MHRVARRSACAARSRSRPSRSAAAWSPQGRCDGGHRRTVGGDEFFQLYTLGNGRLTLLTDGKSRNEFGAWSQEGRSSAIASTRRNGTDTDLYVMDPRDPAIDRLVAEVKGGGWNIADFAPGGAQRLRRSNYISVTKSDLYLLDVASGRLTPIGDPKQGHRLRRRANSRPTARCG